MRSNAAIGFLLLGCASSAPPAAPSPPAPAPASPADAPSAAPSDSIASPAVQAEAPAEVPTVEEPPQDEVEDDLDQVVAPGATRRAHPLDGLSDEEVAERVVSDLASLGSMSIGKTNGGRLLNGVQMAEDPRWKLTDPAACWGTRETVDALTRAIARVHDEHPDTPPLYIGHISSRSGGPLHPHISHQSGRDADIGYYYVEKDPRWFRRASAKNLDLDRTWSLVRALIVETDVALILIDHSIQRLLRRHAESIGEDRAWLDTVFRGGGGRRALIRHAKGHATHIHVRFYNPEAQETARRAFLALIEHQVIKQPAVFVRHRVRKGETLGKLARRFDTTVKAIRRANGLRSTKIIAGRVYRIPRKGKAAVPKEVVVPARRLPPPRVSTN